MHCVVLAGGTPRPGEPPFEEAGGGPKALIEIGGRPMVQWVLDVDGPQNLAIGRGRLESR